jgi:DnaK suppressor protein
MGVGEDSMAQKKTAAKKKAAPKKTAAKKKAAPKKTAVKKKAAPKKAAAKKAAPKKAAAKKAAPKKARTKKNATAGDTGFTDFVPYKERRGENYMNEGQIDHFRMLLSAWKQELMEKVDQTVHHMQDESGNIPDPNDRATLESDFTMELRARDRERKLIKKIEESFNLLDAGDYGYCENCGEVIGVRRLEARPTATLCIECKTLDEIREKHRV